MSSATGSTNALPSLKSPATATSASTVPVATAASHAAALKIGLQMLGFNIYYIYRSSQALPDSKDPKPVAVEGCKSLSDVSDMLALLHDASKSECVGRLSYVKARKSDTLRNVECLGNDYDFGSYIQLLEEKEKHRHGPPDAHHGKRKGTYVVIPAADTISAESQNQLKKVHQTSRDEEGWDLV